MSVSKRNDGIWIIDADRKTLFANEPMCTILGVQASALIGSDSFRYVFPEDVEAAARLFAQKKDGSFSPFRFRLRRQDGSPIWTDVQGNPMYNAAGEFMGILGTFTVSDRQQP